jgi:hypothetical protein
MSGVSTHKFKLVSTPAFDARRGFKRCSLPGVGASARDSRLHANADFWVDPAGRLMIRFSCQGYTEHCHGLLLSGKPIPDAQLEPFAMYVSSVLLDWMADGIDDTPEAFDLAD